MTCRLGYVGATPGANSNDYTLFSTVAAGFPALAALGLHFYALSLAHDQAGTLKVYKSHDGGATWVQVAQQAMVPSATAESYFECRVSCYADWKVAWTNGGSSQTTWAVDQRLERSASAKSLAAIVQELGGTWWDLTQNTTVTEASGGSVGTWGTIQCTRSGSGPWSYNEGFANSSHFVSNASLTNVAYGPGTTCVVLRKPTGGRPWCWVGSANNCWSYFNLDTGVWGSSFGAVQTSQAVALGGGEWLIAVTHLTGGSISASFGSASDNSLFQWTGDGRESLIARDPTAAELLLVSAGVQGTFTQRRATQVVPHPVGALGTLAQVTAANQPFLWDGTSWTQANGLRFNGAQFMRVAAADRAQPSTLIIVCTPTSTTGTYALTDSFNTNGRQNVYMQAGEIRVFDGVTAATGMMITAGRQVITVQHNGAASFVRRNGAQSANFNPGTAARTGGLTLGAQAEATLPLNGMVKSVVLIDAAISAADILAIETLAAA